MNRETLLAELDRLLDLGEPLLTMFPKKKDPGDWWFQLPDNISPYMRLYADNVALRAEDRKRYQDSIQQERTAYIAEWVEYLEVGLLGWRAIGVLK